MEILPNETGQAEYVYLIGCAENSLVKIGRSVDVSTRLAAIQRMSPAKLTLLWKTEGGAELETALHRRFRVYRSHGEWFDLPGRDAFSLVATAAREIGAEARRVRFERRQASKMRKIRHTFRPSAGAAIWCFESRQRVIEERIRTLAEKAGFHVGEVVSIIHAGWSGPETGAVTYIGKSDGYLFGVAPNDGRRHRFENLFRLSDIAHQRDVDEFTRVDMCEPWCYCEAVRNHNYSRLCVDESWIT